MTVLVGVLCQDGVVIGSDSSATFTAGQFRTIEQPTKKTFVVEPDVILAGTGAAGFAQRFQAVVQQVRGGGKWGPPNQAAGAFSLDSSSLGQQSGNWWDH